MGRSGFTGLFVLVLGFYCTSAYIIPSNDIVADVQIYNLDNPATMYFTYKADVVLGNSVAFPVVGSTADGNKKITIEPRVGGPKTKYVRQEVKKAQEGGKTVIVLTLKTTVRNLEKKIKYNGLTTITYKAGQEVQWFAEHEARGVLNYKGKGCDPDDIECNGEILREGISVRCQEQTVSPGVYKFNCVGVDPSKITLSAEHILWLKAAEGQSQNLDVIIPNYRAEELIRAGLKAGRVGSTNVNILLRKPETIYNVQAQDTPGLEANIPSVNLQYEEVNKPISVHYPTDQRYNPLAGPIREP